MSVNNLQQTNPAIQSAKNLAVVIYALQAATFAVAFTFFLAPILIFLMRHKAKGTWVESHLRWQLNTFWIGLGGGVIAALTVPSLPGVMIMSGTLMLVVFRIVQGWSRLGRSQTMPPEKS
jgi:uncharacterized membrane protein